MTERKLDVELKSRLLAQRYFLAFLLAETQRKGENPPERINALGKALIAGFFGGVEASQLEDEAMRNLMTADFTEEIAKVTDLAQKFLGASKS